MMKYKETTCAW